MALPVPTNLIIASVFLVFFDIAVVVTRFAVRRKHGGYGIDDWLVLPALLGAVGMSATIIAAVYTANFARHLKFTPDGKPETPAYLASLLKVNYAVVNLSVFCLFFSKLSILMLYRRIFAGKTFRKIIWVLVILECAWGIAFIIPSIFECRPVSTAWTTVVTLNPNCIAFANFAYGTAISNFLIDIMILAVPQRVVWRLNMPMSKKIAVSAAFLLGAFVTGISLARIVFFFGTHNTADVTWTIAPSVYWSAFEGNVAVICACLPTLAPALNKIVSLAQSAMISLQSLVDSQSSSTRSQREGSTEAQTGLTAFGNKHKSTSVVFGGRKSSSSSTEPTLNWDLEANKIGVQTEFIVEREKASLSESSRSEP